MRASELAEKSRQPSEDDFLRVADAGCEPLKGYRLAAERACADRPIVQRRMSLSAAAPREVEQQERSATFSSGVLAGGSARTTRSSSF
jgi:hypothetical protein